MNRISINCQAQLWFYPGLYVYMYCRNNLNEMKTEIKLKNHFLNCFDFLTAGARSDASVGPHILSESS